MQNKKYSYWLSYKPLSTEDTKPIDDSKLKYRKDIKGIAMDSNLGQIIIVDDDTEELPLFTPEEWRSISLDKDPYDWYPKFPKCECGAWKTYGENNSAAYHSNWCPTQTR